MHELIFFSCLSSTLHFSGSLYEKTGYIQARRQISKHEGRSVGPYWPFFYPRAYKYVNSVKYMLLIYYQCTFYTAYHGDMDANNISGMFKTCFWKHCMSRKVLFTRFSYFLWVSRQTCVLVKEHALVHTRYWVLLGIEKLTEMKHEAFWNNNVS